MSKTRFVIENLFLIHDKAGNLVPFTLNNIQSDIDKEVLEADSKRSTILKFRQGGCTSFIMAWFLVECMSKFCRAVMLAHDRDHTEKLLRRAQLLLSNLKGPAPDTERMNANEIVFRKTGASFHIGTAGSSQFGRSDTITHLHMSEFAFWKDPESLQAGLLQAVPHDTGIVIQETTANGWGSYHQRLYYRALGGDSRYKPLFYPWHIFEEYSSPIPPNFKDLTEEEEALKTQLDLRLEQIQWRREKIDEFGGDVGLFKQEYPNTIEEAFRLTGGSLFNPILVETKDWVNMRTYSYHKGHPQRHYNYSLGADVAGGTGNDYSSIVGVCVETNEQVLRYRNNKIDPVSFANIIADFGLKYNTALLNPEINSHGISTLSVLKEIYPKHKIYKMPQGQGMPSNLKQTIPALHYGWKTTATTKPYMVGIAIQVLLEGMKIYDPILFDELKSFSETDSGRLEGLGDHDDTAIAFMLSCLGLLKLRRFHAVGLLEGPFIGEDLYGNTENLQQKEEEVKQKEKKTVKCTWRDEQGNLLIRAEDILKPKVKNDSIWSMQ